MGLDSARAAGLDAAGLAADELDAARAERLDAAGLAADELDAARAAGLDVGLDAAARAELARRWREAALMEHASIAAFARFTLQLLQLGAPHELVVESQRAMLDETEHARRCFSLAARYAGSPEGPGPLSIDGALRDESWAAIIGLTFREGCVGETAAALEASETLADARDPLVRRTLELIARDELRHATLAWRVAAWALEHDTSGEVRATLESELRRLRALAAPLTSGPLSGGVAPHAPAAPELATHARASHGLAPHARASHGPAPHELAPPERALHARASHGLAPHELAQHTLAQHGWCSAEQRRRWHEAPSPSWYCRAPSACSRREPWTSRRARHVRSPRSSRAALSIASLASPSSRVQRLTQCNARAERRYAGADLPVPE